MPGDPDSSRSLSLQRVPCRVCGEGIARNARKCIHCSEYQTRDVLGLRGKTLWDVLGLLIVPAVLAVGGFMLDRAATERQNILNEQRAQSAALQAYFDKVAELLLRSPGSDFERETIGTIARSKTITALHELDGPRKGLVIKLLLEANVLQRSPPLITLRGANLEGAELREVNLSGVDLFGSSFAGANLVASKMRAANLRASDFAGDGALGPADLRDADLFQANLKGASLAGADLRGADLRRADLFEADLRDADLRQADLRGAFLERADTGNARLEGAVLCQTIMSDGSRVDRDCDAEQAFSMPILDPASLLGEYDIRGTNPLGSGMYKGTVTVTQSSEHNRLRVRWEILQHTWEGQGSVTDDGKLYITYSGRFDGDILLSLMSDGSLLGEWRGAGPVKSAMQTGTEFWRRRATSG